MNPAARGVVKTDGSLLSARVWQVPTAQSKKVVEGTGVYNPPAPDPVVGIGRMESISPETDGMGRLSPNIKIDKLTAEQQKYLASFDMGT